jgi:hypothetical protein
MGDIILSPRNGKTTIKLVMVLLISYLCNIIWKGKNEKYNLQNADNLPIPVVSKSSRNMNAAILILHLLLNHKYKPCTTLHELQQIKQSCVFPLCCWQSYVHLWFRLWGSISFLLHVPYVQTSVINYVPIYTKP